MTPDEVRAVPGCGPYKPVARTGGLECPNFEFEGIRMNVSFTFGEDGLRVIQLWLYEGTNRTRAVQVTERLLEHLSDRFGALASVFSPPNEPVRAESLVAAAEAPIGARPGRADVCPVVMPENRQIQGTVGHAASLRVYYVFLFYAVRPTQ
jgi:hypothetical protein